MGWNGMIVSQETRPNGFVFQQERATIGGSLWEVTLSLVGVPYDSDSAMSPAELLQAAQQLEEFGLGQVMAQFQTWGDNYPPDEAQFKAMIALLRQWGEVGYFLIGSG